MRNWHFPRRHFSLREKRLIFGEGEPSGVDNLGEIEFDTNPHTDNVPEGTESENGENMRDRVKKKYGGRKQMMSGRKFFDMIHRAVTNVLNGAIHKQQYEDNRLKAGIARARDAGKYRPDGPRQVSTGSIERDLETKAKDLNEFIERATLHIWRIPEMQKGLVKVTSALERGWNFVMDLIQEEGELDSDHELMRSAYWTGEKFRSGEPSKGARIPGVYYDGRLSRIGSNVFGATNQRALSGETEKFKRFPPDQQKFTNVVPSRFGGAVQKEANVYLKLPKNKFNQLQWHELQKSPQHGKPHIFHAHKAPGAVDDAGVVLPGEAAFDGLVFVYEDLDDPTQKSEVLYMDFDETNRMIYMIKNDPTYYKLVTTEGYFSKGQAENASAIPEF